MADFSHASLIGPAMAQYVYTMNRVGKIVPPKRQILKNISLSFFPGAKIGVLGLNGSGKSTLLKIMAGLDKDIEGEAVPMPNLKIGYLPQEPQIEPTQTVRQAVEEGIGGVLAAKKRLDEVYAAYAEEDADFDKLAAEQAELEAIIATESDGGNTDLQLEIAADALRLPPCRPVPPVALQARHAAARRTHQPPRCRIGGLAGTIPGQVSRHGGGHHP
jgi:energy-dependent translational throttle protein EttA